MRFCGLSYVVETPFHVYRNIELVVSHPHKDPSTAWRKLSGLNCTLCRDSIVRNETALHVCIYHSAFKPKMRTVQNGLMQNHGQVGK